MSCGCDETPLEDQTGVHTHDVTESLTENILNTPPIITTPLEYLAEARKFLTEYATLQSIQINDFNINITTDWLHSLHTVYCALDSSALTKNTDIGKESTFDHSNPDHVEEIRKYAFQLGSDSKYWEGTGCYTFPNYIDIPILQQIQSSLNMFLINVFLKDAKYKIVESVVSSELGTVQAMEDIDSIPDRVLSSVSQFINVENVTDILLQLINHGIFDKKLQNDFVYNGDRLTFPIQLRIKDDENDEQGVIYMLHLNLIQHCTTTRSFRAWVHSMWDQITDLNGRIDNLKCVIQCKSVQCSTELDALNAEIYALLQQLQSKNMTISDLESQLQGDINTVSTSIEVLQTNISELEEQKSAAEQKIVRLTEATPKHKLLEAIRNRVQRSVDEKEEADLEETLKDRRNLLERAQREKERIVLELDSVQHQVECTQMSLQELKQKAERLKMKSRLVEQQQQNVKIQQGSLEIMWSKQNATIMSLSQEMEKCTNNLDTFQAQYQIQKEQLKETEERCSQLREKIQVHTLASQVSSEEQNEILQHMDYIAAETTLLQKEFDEYAAKTEQTILSMFAQQCTVEEKLQEKLQLDRDIEDVNIDITRLTEQIKELEVRQQKMRFSRTMTDLLVQTKIQSYLEEKHQLTGNLTEYVSYDKVLYDLIDRIVQQLEKNEHARSTMVHRVHLLENRITQMQKTILQLREQIRDLKQTKINLLEKIRVLKDHLDENVAEKSEHQKHVRFLEHQISILKSYNAQLIEHQKVYTKHIEDVEQAATSADLLPITPSSTVDHARRERLQYLTHLDKLTGMLAICKSNYGLRRNLYDVFKLSEILKMCKKLIEIKLRVDQMNRTKYFGLGSGAMTKMGATLDLTKFITASYPSHDAERCIRRYLQKWVDRWRLWVWKTKRINRFPRPTKMELMRFEFQMTLYRIQKQKRKEKQ